MLTSSSLSLLLDTSRLFRKVGVVVSILLMDSFVSATVYVLSGTRGVFIVTLSLTLPDAGSVTADILCVESMEADDEEEDVPDEEGVN